MRTLLCHFVAQHAPFAVATDALRRGQISAEPGADQLAGELCEVVIKRPKGLDALLVFGRNETLEHLVVIDRFSEPPSGIVHLKGANGILRRHTAEFDSIHESG